MNYLSEKITIAASVLSFACASIALMSEMPKKVVECLYWAAVIFIIIGVIAAAYANTLYGWDW